MVENEAIFHAINALRRIEFLQLNVFVPSGLHYIFPQTGLSKTDYWYRLILHQTMKNVSFPAL